MLHNKYCGCGVNGIILIEEQVKSAERFNKLPS
jgi:hypothetical protein